MENKIKKSELFWSIIVSLTMVVIAFMSPITYLVIQSFMSLALVFILVYNLTQYVLSLGYYMRIPLFLYSNPFLFIYTMIKIIIKMCIWIVKNPLKNFNDWIDTEKEKKLKFKEFKDNINDSNE